MAFSTSGPRGLSSEINVTPLIDVLLVLLIIFMVIVPLAPLGLSTTIPAPGDPHSPPQRAETPILIQLDGDPTHLAYRIDGVPVDAQGVASHLQILLATRANRDLLVQADPQLEFGVVSRVIDEGRAAGAETVGLLTPKLLH